MKSGRTRILIVVIAASLVVWIFMHWSDWGRGVQEGWDLAGSVRLENPSRALA